MDYRESLLKDKPQTQSNWVEAAKQDVIDRTAETLSQNGIQTDVVETAKDARQTVLDLIPKGSQVFQMTSVTLDEAGISAAINESGDYDAVRNQLGQLDRETDADQMRRLGSAPDWAVGSVHAVTEDGHLVIASNTGSQLAAYVYGASHVVWVVGAQKLVKNLDEALERIYQHTLPLESVRARKAYNLPDFSSFVSKLLIINKEIVPGRARVVIVKEPLGF